MQDQKPPLKTSSGQPLRHQNSQWIFERLRQQDEESTGNRNPQGRDGKPDFGNDSVTAEQCL